MLCPSCNAETGDVSKFCPSCGATLVRAADADDYVGKILAGKYRVEQLIGEGGMGKVYKAMQMALDKPVVLKVLRQTLLSDERTVARFHREAKAASRLNHANSISVLDFGQAQDGALFIAMEFVAGRDLHYVLSKEWPLPEARIVRIIGQVLSALADAHGAGVVHRDLKPENIMVEQRRGEPDFVKVLDFGIAKIQDQSGEEGPALTRAGFVCGTPEYMSPEQARGAAVDHRSDLYAVGVILYQLTTGLLPFDSDSAVGFATKHLTEEPPPPSKRRPDAKISLGMERLIMKALSKDPNDRPQSAEEFRAELLEVDKERRNGNAARRGVSSPVLQPLPRKMTPVAEPLETSPGQERTWPGDEPAPAQPPKTFPDPMERAQRVARLEQEKVLAASKALTTEPRLAARPDRSMKILQVATGALVATTLALGGYYFYQVRRASRADPPVVVAPPVKPDEPPQPPYLREIPQDKRDPAESARLEALGDEAQVRGELAAAAENYQQAFLKQPKPQLSLKLGEVYYQANRLQEARGWWLRHLKDRSGSKARRYILEALPDLADAAGTHG